MLSVAIIQLPRGDFVDAYVAQLAAYGSSVSGEEAESDGKVPILVAGGVWVRTYVGRSFHGAEAVRSARTAASDVIAYQLDEETGVRGFALTGDTAFLQPFRSVRWEAVLAG